MPTAAENGANGFTPAQDKTLSERLRPLASNEDLQNSIQGIHTEIDNIKAEMEAGCKQIGDLQEQQVQLKGRIKTLDWHMQQLTRDVANLRQEMNNRLNSLRDTTNRRMERMDKRMEDLYQGMNQRMEGMDKRIEGLYQGMNQRIEGLYQGMNQRIEGLYQGMNQRIEGLYQGMNQRMEGMDKRMDGLRQGMNQRMDGLRQGMGKRIDSLHDRINKHG